MYIHPAAADEADAAYSRYADIDERVGANFVSRVRETIAEIEHRPRSFAPHIAGTRRAAVEEFPYRVVFLERDGEIRLVAVMHERQRPGYWRGRI